MPVTAEILGITATIKDRVWTSENQRLENLLNDWIDILGLRGQHWHPDEWADKIIAQNVIEAMGTGEIVEATDPPEAPGYDPDIVYSSGGED